MIVKDNYQDPEGLWFFRPEPFRIRDSPVYQCIRVFTPRSCRNVLISAMV